MSAELNIGQTVEGEISLDWAGDGKYIVANFDPPIEVERIAHLDSDSYPAKVIRTKDGRARAIVHLASLFGLYLDTQSAAVKSFYSRELETNGYSLAGQVAELANNEMRKTNLAPPAQAINSHQRQRVVGNEVQDKKMQQHDPFYMSEEELERRFGIDPSKLIV